MRSLQGVLAATVLLSLPAVSTAQSKSVDFNRDIRPILSRCLKCHGPDNEARQGSLRLDEPAAALAALDGGGHAIVPKKPKESVLLERIKSKDEDLRMPPLSEGDPLSAEQIALVEKWITEGAAFERHWSFVSPRIHPLPKVSNPKWIRNELDYFALAAIDRKGWKPATQADRATLIRRVTLDLTGLPPTPEEVQRFINDPSPDAYDRLVDRLLQSTAFGERWARVWLDIARYADSAGYAQDPPRTIWKYRDWVIQAINESKSYGQFTIEQLAGDMLKDPSDRQLIATAFHRNTMTNSEGGTDDEEFRNAAIVDRVNTTMQVWMGLTMGCAQCHTHKYDPISQKEYFQFFDVFNQSEDSDKGDERPTLQSFSLDQLARKGKLEAEIKKLEEVVKKQKPVAKLPKWMGKAPAKFVRIELDGDKKILSLAEVQVFAGDKNVALEGKAKQQSTAFAGPAKYAIDGNTDGNYQSMSTTHTETTTNPWWEVELKSVAQIDRIVIWNRTDGGAPIGSRLNGVRIIVLNEKRLPLWIKTIAKAPAKDATLKIPAKLKKAETKLLAEYMEKSNPSSPERARLEAAKKELAGIRGTTTPIMRELAKRRETFIQLRGNFLQKSDKVTAAVPAAFNQLPKNTEPTRLTVAEWLVARDNPLTARVTVNRFWEHMFGIGLVETSEDFGRQGELPSHPEMLDQLAVRLMEHDWDTKWLLRTMVTSATYMQSSAVNEVKAKEDPKNRWLARGPRFRMSAEMLRDQALAVAGLLSNKMYGPSVRPPRPNLGLRAAFGGSTDWKTSPGEDRYRRGLYTSWRRTTPYPSMTTFDAPSREFCTVRRIRTNTPLQALVTMNDPVFIEAAQGLARRVLRVEGTVEERIQFAMQLCLGRPATADESQRIAALLQKARERFASSPEDAMALATEPIGALPAGQDVATAAAWTLVGNVLMNLDEFIARP